MQLRDYQRDAINAIYEYFSGNLGNPLVVVPTGGGKSLIIGKFCEEVIKAWPNQRILMLTHVRELVEQNYTRLKQVWPEAPAGIYSASLGRRDTTSALLFCSIQSVYKKAYQIGRFDLVLVDECHLIPPSGEGMYNALLSDLKKINPALKVIGCSATPWRMKSGHLIGDDTLFTDIAYDKADIKFLVEQGYLCKVVPKRMDHTFDTTGVGVRGGEFVQKELQKLTDVDDLNKSVVKEMLTWGQDRRSWLVFCTGVEHAEHIRDALRMVGITAETVTGTTPKLERERIIREYQSGKIRALTNCDVLTTGFDAPQTDLLAVLRPTKSPGLWVQIVGRGMRTAPGKADCLVLDFAGNTATHGPVDMITMGRRKRRAAAPGEAPAKTCPQCKSMLSVFVRECECGYLFAANTVPKYDPNADDKSLLSFDSPIVEREVNRLTFSRHRKAGSPDSLKVTYFSGFTQVAQQWVCLEHPGKARVIALTWWRQWIGTEAPKTVTDAIQETGVSKKLDPAAIIQIKTAGKYPEIISARLEVAC